VIGRHSLGNRALLVQLEPEVPQRPLDGVAVSAGVADLRHIAVLVVLRVTTEKLRTPHGGLADLPAGDEPGADAVNHAQADRLPLVHLHLGGEGA
jgi:hypothetical protein